MDKDIKTKLMMVFAVTAFLMLFAFQGKAEEQAQKMPASVEETSTTVVPSTQEILEEEVTEEEESIPTYLPSTDDSGSEDYTFDE